MKTPYRFADKALKSFQTFANAEFQNQSALGFDELNVLGVKAQVETMYSRIDTEAKRRFSQIAKEVIEDTENEIGAEPTEFDIPSLVAALLSRYDPVTKYVYTSEWVRKRDRLAESIMSDAGNQEMRKSLKRALNLLSAQVRQYADNLTDETRLEVFKRANVTEVMWNTQKDGKVCAECAERNGEIYSVNAIPPKHYHCRCYLTAVK